MNPDDRASLPSPRDPEIAAASPRARPHRDVHWAVWASLALGAGALAGNMNTCNVINTGIQVIQQGPP